MTDCPICQGRGWVVASNGGAGLARRCSCRSALPLRERLMAAGVWESHLHCSRETWRGDWPAEKLQAFGRTQHFCTVLGPVGTGKTHLATAILGDWLLAGGRGLWRESSSAIEGIKRGVAAGTAERLIDQLKSPEHLLVLDDLLTEQGTDWSEFLLSHVLRYRQGRQLPTVITVNVSDLADLDAIEPRLSSRCGAGIVIGLRGADRRTERITD